MIFASSARWPHTWFGARKEASNTRVAQQRRTPFLSDMSDSVKARSDPYGQLMTRLDAKRLKRNEPLAQYTTFRIGGPADLFYDATLQMIWQGQLLLPGISRSSTSCSASAPISSSATWDSAAW